jgi:hypothetical protein
MLNYVPNAEVRQVFGTGKYFDNFYYRRATKMVAGVKINIQ